jgi:hypothetical protein
VLLTYLSPDGASTEVSDYMIERRADGWAVTKKVGVLVVD